MSVSEKNQAWGRNKNKTELTSSLPRGQKRKWPWCIGAAVVSQNVSAAREVSVDKILMSASLDMSVRVQVTIAGKTAGIVKGWI